MKIRSRSSKSNHFFPRFWWCICASLVKFQSLVKETVCTQTFYCIKKIFLQRAITLRELAPSPYFLLCRYILLIPMCLQKLMNIHPCIFKILGKTSIMDDGHMDGRTTWKQYTHPPHTNKVCGGITSGAIPGSYTSCYCWKGNCTYCALWWTSWPNKVWLESIINTILTQNTGTLKLLTIFVLKFQQDVSKKVLEEWQIV